MCLPKCIGCYKTFLCGVENCNFTEECEEKQAFNKVKTLVDEVNLEITDDEIKAVIKEIKNSQFK